MDVTPLDSDSAVPTCLSQPMPYPIPVNFIMSGRLPDGSIIGCGGHDAA